MLLNFYIIVFSFIIPICRQDIDYDSEESSIESENSLLNVTFNRLNNSFVLPSIATKQKSKWKTVNYYIDPLLSRNKIQSVINYLGSHTCLKFKQSSKQNQKFSVLTYMKNNIICQSQLGKKAEPHNTKITLTKSCAESYAITAHETLHALGLKHEHQRKDRDKYTKVFMENIGDHIKNQFGLEKGNDNEVFGMHYDYSSVLHYPSKYNSRSPKRLMESKNIEPFTNMMGNREIITFNDMKLVNLYYCNCTFSSWKCYNSGYAIFPRCGQCVCPKEYTGGKCEQIKDRSINCDLKKYNVSETSQMFESSGIRRCIHYFKTSNDSRIGIYLMYVNTKHKELCREDIGLEVKYLNDKGTTGLCLCGIYEDIFLFSENNEVVITYTGLESSNWFYGFYKKVLKSIKKEDEICYKDKCFIEPEKKPQEIPDKKLNTEKSIETTTTQQAKLHTEESLQEKPDIIEGPNCTPHC